MNGLYPMKFEPILKDKIWGGPRLREVLNKTSASAACGESWEVSGLQDNLSVVANGFLSGNNLQELAEIYMGDLLGDSIYKRYGIEFPLLVKFIDANDNLSIQVHPDDELARKRHQAFGKTEMWYIVDSEPGARLISGFNSDVDERTYLNHLNSGTLPEIMQFEEVEPGDVFFIPAGTVHAIGPGILLAEIQQTSDVTYRIYDWDRVDESGKGRELHTGLALAAIDYRCRKDSKKKVVPVLNQTAGLVDCRYFTTSILAFDRQVDKDFNFIDSFVIYMCLEGSYTLQYSDHDRMVVSKGETVLVPAVIKNILLQPGPDARILETFIKT